MRIIVVAYIFIILSAFLLPVVPAHAFEKENVSIKPFGSLHVGYDDNVNSTKENRESDIIITPGAGIRVTLSEPTRTVQMSLLMKYRAFTRHQNLNNLSENLLLEYRKELSPLRNFSLSESFEHSYDAQSFSDALGRAPGLLNHYANKFNFTYEIQSGQKLSVKTGYDNQVDWFAQGADSCLNRIFITPEYSLGPKTALFLDEQLGIRTFWPGKSAISNRIGPGLKRKITKQLKWEMLTGLDTIKAYGGKTYFKPCMLFSLTNEFNDKSEAGVSFRKEHSLGPYSQDLFDNWQANAFYKRNILPRLSMELEAFHGEGNYVASGISENLSGGLAKFTYDINRLLKAELTYRLTLVQSNQENREYLKNELGIGLGAEF